MIRKFYFLAIIGTLLLSACTPSQDSAKTQLPDVIKIGFISPLTGNAAAYGQDSKEAVELYFKEHPTIGGKTVQVIYEDGKCNGQDAANAIQKLINVDQVQVVIGGFCSGEVLAEASIAEANRVAILSPGASSPAVTTAGDYTFRISPSDAQVSASLVDQIKKDGYKKIAMFSEQTDYAQGYRGAAKEHLKTYPEMALVLDEAYPVDSADFRTLLVKTQESGAEALISISQTPVGNGFTVKQAKELGLNIQIYGTDTIDGSDFFNITKGIAEGVKQVTPAENPSRTSYQEFAKVFGSFQSSPIFAALSYDAAGIVARAIEQVGYNGTKLKEYWYSMPVYSGVAGDHHFDSNGDNALAAGVKVVKDGKFVFEE